MFNPSHQGWPLGTILFAIGIGGCIFVIAANLGSAYDATELQRLEQQTQQLKTENQQLKAENQRLSEIHAQIHQLTREQH